jgi:hypothetical protein
MVKILLYSIIMFIIVYVKCFTELCPTTNNAIANATLYKPIFR